MLFGKYFKHSSNKKNTVAHSMNDAVHTFIFDAS